jgi:hypothetical protein
MAHLINTDRIFRSFLSESYEIRVFFAFFEVPSIH